MDTQNVVNKPISIHDPILLMIENYKKHIANNQLTDEIYKWELIEKYKGKPNLDIDNLTEEFKSIDYSNLVYNMAKPVLNRLVSEKTEETRQLFRVLFDESKDLTDRVKSFSKESLLLYNEIKGKHSHHQDERSISAYLTYRYPEKYIFYKYTYYSKYCKLLGIKQAKKNEKYSHYLSLIDDLIEKYIAPDNELIDQVAKYLPQYYDVDISAILTIKKVIFR